MRYLVLATDYDGTLAERGATEEATFAALERFRSRGGRPILVTGRELADLRQVMPRLDLFERIVAENGGLLYDPQTGRERMLAEPVDLDLVSALRAQGVQPLSAGRTIVATVVPHELTVIETIRALGLELHVLFNKGAVMILPSGVNKATGLGAALDELELSPHNTAAIGDAENDHALLQFSGLSVAVANAIPALRVHADIVTTGSCGAGVRELVNRLLDEGVEPSPRRQWLAVGTRGGEVVSLPPLGTHVLISGCDRRATAGLRAVLLDQLAERRFQFCVIASGGVVDVPDRVVRLGTSTTAPPLDAVMGALRRASQDVVLSIEGLPKGEQASYLRSLRAAIQGLWRDTARPHWVFGDGSHALARETWPHDRWLEARGPSLGLVVDDPEWASSLDREHVDAIVAADGVPPTLARWLDAQGLPPAVGLGPGAACLWHTDGRSPMPFTVRSVPL